MDAQTILKEYEKAIRQTLMEEQHFSEEAGMTYSHYWLHLKLDQIIQEAEKRFVYNESTPCFPIEKEIVIQ